MKKNKLKSPTIFHSEKEYYQKDWQEYYPTIVRLVRKNSNILDVGCGNGSLAQHLQKNMDCNVVGIDISEEAIASCKAKGIEAIKCDI